MKSSIRHLLRAAALSPALFALSLAFASSDLPAQALTATGGVPVKAAGPYVEIGSYRIHVRVRMGKPSAVLPDGTWLYSHYTVNGSEANGTLVIHFEQGRVSRMSLVTEATALAMVKAAHNRTEIAQR